MEAKKQILLGLRPAKWRLSNPRTNNYFNYGLPKSEERQFWKKHNHQRWHTGLKSFWDVCIWQPGKINLLQLNARESISGNALRSNQGVDKYSIHFKLKVPPMYLLRISKHLQLLSNDTEIEFLRPPKDNVPKVWRTFYQLVQCSVVFWWV